MKKLDRAINLIEQEMKKEYGENAELEDGESVVGVFKDCTVILEKEYQELKVQVFLGNPYTFECNLDILEEK